MVKNSKIDKNNQKNEKQPHQHNSIIKPKFNYPLGMERNTRRLDVLKNGKQTTQEAKNCIEAIEILEGDIHLRKTAQLLEEVKKRRIETSLATRMQKLRTPQRNKYVMQDMLVKRDKNKGFVSQIFAPKTPMLKIKAK